MQNLVRRLTLGTNGFKVIRKQGSGVGDVETQHFVHMKRQIRAGSAGWEAMCLYFLMLDEDMKS